MLFNALTQLRVGRRRRCFTRHDHNIHTAKGLAIIVETLTDEPPDSITYDSFPNALSGNRKSKPCIAAVVCPVEYRKKVIHQSTATLKYACEVSRPGKSMLAAYAEYHAARPRAHAGPLVA